MEATEAARQTRQTRLRFGKPRTGGSTIDRVHYTIMHLMKAFSLNANPDRKGNRGIGGSRDELESQSRYVNTDPSREINPI